MQAVQVCQAPARGGGSQLGGGGPGDGGLQVVLPGGGQGQGAGHQDEEHQGVKSVA